MPTPQNFFALCHNDDEVVVKRIPLNAAVQQKMTSLFNVQAQAFVQGITEEIEFNGDWKPENNEVLTIGLTNETSLMVGAINANASSLSQLNVSQFEEENVRAIFTGSGQGAATTLAVQRFMPQQLLSKKFTLMLTNNSFGELTEPAFTLASSLVCVIADEKVKFKSFASLRTVFDISEHYKEATDDDIGHFASHDSLQIDDVEAFKENSDQTVRKLIHVIEKQGVLDEYSADDISDKAQELEFTVNVQSGKVVMPSEKKDIKKLLHFLTDGFYEAPLSGKKYLTNSKKPA
jgi:hypothetical protein